MGYKNIMNLPDSPNTGYKTIKQETQAGNARKFLPAAGFFTGPGEAGRIAIFLREKSSAAYLSRHPAGCP